MQLKAAVEFTVRHRRGVLVYDADAGRLQDLLKKLVSPCKVFFADFRTRIPATSARIREILVPFHRDDDGLF
jgi:hypothetical protein